MEFTTKIESAYVDIYSNTDLAKYLGLHKDNDIDSVSCVGVIRWSVEFEAREYGIKAIYIYINGVDIEGEAEYYEMEDVEFEDKQYKEFAISSSDFTVVNEMEITSDSIYPASVEIDFAKKTITVS